MLEKHDVYMETMTYLKMATERSFERQSLDSGSPASAPSSFAYVTESLHLLESVQTNEDQ